MNTIPSITYQYRKDLERERKKYMINRKEIKKTYTNTCKIKEEREKKSIPASGEKRERESKNSKRLLLKWINKLNNSCQIFDYWISFSLLRGR